MKGMNKQEVAFFQKKVLQCGDQYFRDMSWRQTNDPYKIFLSEVMLQQTQVDRVKEKYQQFVKAFPTVQKLAQAEFSQVLALWSGLGYNRRALWLHQAAKIVVEKYHSEFPDGVDLLDELPGIGSHTAGAIVAFAFNKPAVFIETNIRSVFIHEFFHDKKNIDDKQILSLIQETLYSNNPQKWYWALMDYGAVLKKQEKNPSRKSKHYAKQSQFEGSNRQLRGKILRLLIQAPMNFEELAQKYARSGRMHGKDKNKSEKKNGAEELHDNSVNAQRLRKILTQLLHDGLISQDSQGVYLVSS